MVAMTSAMPRATDRRKDTFMTVHASMRAIARSTRRGASVRALVTWSLIGFLPGRTSYSQATVSPGPGAGSAPLWNVDHGTRAGLVP